MNSENDSNLRQLLLAHTKAEDVTVPDFDMMWNRAGGEARRQAILWRSVVTGSVAILVLIVALPWWPSTDPEPVHFCAQEAVEDWLLMMDSPYFKARPSDSLFSFQAEDLNQPNNPL